MTYFGQKTYKGRKHLKGSQLRKSIKLYSGFPERNQGICNVNFKRINTKSKGNDNRTIRHIFLMPFRISSGELNLLKMKVMRRL